MALAMRLAKLRVGFLGFLVLPLAMGAKGDGCAAGSTSAAPDVRGTWGIEYDDRIGVEVKIGGAVYTEELGAGGGAVTINHAGKPYTFDLACSRPEIVCPSGELVKPAPGTCGGGTSNPNCDLVCDGGVTVQTTESFGVIGETGESFRLYLGAGVVTNGINCALLGYSLADADLVTEGKGEQAWDATEMERGLVTIGYAGGCLFAGDINGEDHAVVVGAEVKFTTGFTGVKL